MVIRRIENEQGCTLSRRAEIKTSGRSQVPSLLILQIIDEVTELFLRMTMPTIAIRTILIIIIIFFIVLWSYIHLKLKFNYITVLVFKKNSAFNKADSSRTVGIGIIYNFNLK